MNDDDSSVMLRLEEARMRDLLKVAMGPDGVPSALQIEKDHEEEEDPQRKHGPDAEAFMDELRGDGDGPAGEAARDDGAGADGIPAVSTTTTTTPSNSRVLHDELVESAHSSHGTSDVRETRRSPSPRVGRKAKQYDLTMAAFICCSIVGTVGLVFLWAVPPLQKAAQLPQIADPVVVGGVASGASNCDAVAAKLDANEHVSSSALKDDSSPQGLAKQWMCERDPARLGVDDPGFLPRYALAVLFYATSGREPSDTGPEETDWIDRSNWLTGVGYCSWFGITCVDEDNNLESDVDGEILQVELSRNSMRGTLPGELSLLSDAFGFHFDSNYIRGRVPSELGRLTDLRELELSDNKLTGSVPGEVGSMVGLRQLTLAANDLTGTLPETLARAAHLHYIAVENNFLNGTIPSAFGSLTALETIHASNNALSGSIPEELYGLTSLVNVKLSANRLEGTISSSLSQLVNLENFYLAENNLTGEIPDAFSEMDLLGGFLLGGNLLSGSIPASLGESLALTALSFEGNALAGDMPEAICALTEIGSLESLTADCDDVASGKTATATTTTTTTTVDMAKIDGAKLVDAGQVGDLKRDEDRAVVLDGVICGCCTECF